MAILVQINIGTGNQNSVELHNMTRINECDVTSGGRK